MQALAVVLYVVLICISVCYADEAVNTNSLDAIGQLKTVAPYDMTVSDPTVAASLSCYMAANAPINGFPIAGASFPFSLVCNGYSNAFQNARWSFAPRLTDSIHSSVFDMNAPLAAALQIRNPTTGQGYRLDIDDNVALDSQNYRYLTKPFPSDYNALYNNAQIAIHSTLKIDGRSRQNYQQAGYYLSIYATAFAPNNAVLFSQEFKFNWAQPSVLLVDFPPVSPTPVNINNYQYLQYPLYFRLTGPTVLASQIVLNVADVTHDYAGYTPQFAIASNPYCTVTNLATNAVEYVKIDVQLNQLTVFWNIPSTDPSAVWGFDCRNSASIHVLAAGDFAQIYPDVTLQVLAPTGNAWLINYDTVFLPLK